MSSAQLRQCFCSDTGGTAVSAGFIMPREAVAGQKPKKSPAALGSGLQLLT